MIRIDEQKLSKAQLAEWESFTPELREDLHELMDKIVTYLNTKKTESSQSADRPTIILSHKFGK